MNNEELMEKAVGFEDAIFVNVYDVVRKYGGPEEGGWYYDAGFLVKSVFCRFEQDAEEVLEQLRDEYKRTGKRYSVLGGEDYEVFISHGLPERSFPRERPRYA